jgi:histidinol-phosphate/aromatic aminotransferase/cobyric acid decarboxylase-like protein
MHAVVHGSVQDVELAALGLRREDVIDLSANLHPAGPDPAVIEAARAAALDRYPPPDAGPLREAIAAHHGLDPAMVLVTPGATAAIHLVARTLIEVGDAAAIFPPTFGEYRAALDLAGACVREHPAASPAFEVPVAAVEPAALAFLCRPNNPTGTALSGSDVTQLLDRLTGGTLVLDVAYAPFLDGEDGLDAHALMRSGAPVVAVHSMTKLHAIPGLRLGYVVANKATIARIEAAQPSWSIDAPAFDAGLVAIGQAEARRALLAELPATRDRMRAAFEAAGCATAPGRANFLLAEVGDASAARAALLRRGFAVRDCTSFGLPGWVRVAVPASPVGDRFIEVLPAALREVRP